MNEHATLIAFITTVGAIVVLALIGAWTGKPADLAVMTGLIGLGGALIPRRATSSTPDPVTITNQPDDPVPVDPRP